jgi:hypothetical protein
MRASLYRRSGRHGQSARGQPPQRLRSDIRRTAWVPRVYNGRDKTFFFFNFEQYRETSQINNQEETVPTDAYREGIFSAAMIGSPIGTDPMGRCKCPLPPGWSPVHAEYRRSIGTFWEARPAFRAHEWHKRRGETDGCTRNIELSGIQVRPWRRIIGGRNWPRSD